MIMPSLVRIERLMEHGYTRRHIHQVMQERRDAAASRSNSVMKTLSRAWNNRGERKQMARLCKTTTHPTNTNVGLVGILKGTTTTSLPRTRTVLLLKTSPENLWTGSNDSDTEEESDGSVDQSVSLR